MRIEQQREVAILHVHAGKANAINIAMLGELNGALDRIEKEDARALVMTGHGNFFSAGLDLHQLVKASRTQMEELFAVLDQTMVRLLTWRSPLVAAINGHAIAGGCVLALQADVRVMVRSEKARIGLNEVQLGVPLPLFALEPLRAVLAPHDFQHMALGGHLVAAEAAQKIGLVDEVVEPGSLLERCVDIAGGLAGAGDAYALVKAAIRRPILQCFAEHGAAETKQFFDSWFSQATQKRLQAVVARLSA